MVLMFYFRGFQGLCEVHNPNPEFVISNKKTRVVLGRAKGVDQEKSNASSIRRQRGLKFDDVSFMTRRMFYVTTSVAPSGGRRIEYAPRITQAKESASKASGTLSGTMQTWID